MKKIFTMLLTGAFNLIISFHSASAMDGLHPILATVVDEQGRLDQIFQRGIIIPNNLVLYGMVDFAQAYNYSVYDLNMNEIPRNRIFELCSNDIYTIHPEAYIRHIRPDINYINPLPPGDYLAVRYCVPWMIGSVKSNTTRYQGFKLHVSARPETALLVANIVLPILLERNVSHKVMYDLRYMRFVYYLSQYVNPAVLMPDGGSSQAGKFIAIYPNDQRQAIEIAERIDDAFKKYGLGPNHFVKLQGDAQVGNTGGIFVRYGKFASVKYKDVPSTHVAIVNELEQSIQQEIIEQNLGYRLPIGVPDSRRYPWPDYMNSRRLYDGPFLGNLNITWVNPYNPAQVITWNNRPNCWAELEGKQCP